MLKQSIITIALLSNFLIDTSLSCSESITIDEIDLRTGVTELTADMTRFEGIYYFYGFDSNGYPYYVQPSTSASFAVGTSVIGGTNYLAMTWSGTNIDVIDSDTSNGDSSVFFNTQTWYSPFNRQITQFSNAIFYIDDGFFDYATSSDYDFFYTNYYPVRIRATVDFCNTHGFTYEPDTSECPNYDTTIYNDCQSDTHCINCQSWGCAECESGYYKMGNLMACQSCVDNYPNCAQCTDWNGCTSCDSGYSLIWNAACSDETCQ